MKILLLTFYFRPDLCAGSFRNTALVNALLKQIGENDSIDVVTTSPNRYKSFKEEASETEITSNLRITRIKLPAHKSGFADQMWSFNAYRKGVNKFIKENKSNVYDIVIASSSRLFTAFLGARVSRKLGKPLYLDIRDIFSETIDNVIDNKLIRYSLLPVINKIEKYTIKTSVHLNIVSGGFKNHFRRYYKGSLSEYTNGIDDVFLDYNFETDKASELPTITYAGNIGEGQGLHKIIPDMAKLLENKFIFQIIGDGGAKSKLLKAVEDKNLSNVKFFDPVKRDELLKFYKNSDYLFLHLNDYEAFKKVLPSKIFEYAATKKPIIAGVGGFSAEFLKENLPEVLLFNPCDIEDFKSKFEIWDSQLKDRTEFLKEFDRSTIMDNMATSIINTVN